MSKTLAKDEVGDLKRLREQLIGEIDEAQAKLHLSMEQIARHHYHKLGELFIRLRRTFPKGRKGDNEFSRFCKDEFPAISKDARNEYMAYRKRLGPVTAATAAVAFTEPLRHYGTGKSPRNTYQRIVNEEVGGNNGEPFNAPPRSKREEENDIVLDLAAKIVNAGFKVLAVKLHPDKQGGSHDAMRRLNAAKKLLTDGLTRSEIMM